MSIPAIIAASLILGLIAGAGINGDVILPVAACTAAVLFVNRKKIAAQNIRPVALDSQPDIDPNANYHAWPTLEKFAHAVAGECYQHTLEQLLRGDAGNTAAVHMAYLIPEHNNPYDSQAVRIVVAGKTVARLSPEESRSLRHRLVENQLADQITMCGAKIVESEESGQYEIRLDIEPLAFYELPWMAG